MIFLRVLNAVIFIFLLSLVAAWIYDYYKKYDFVSLGENIIAFLGSQALIIVAVAFSAIISKLLGSLEGDLGIGWYIALAICAPTALICYLLWRKFTKNY